MKTNIIFAFLFITIFACQGDINVLPGLGDLEKNGLYPSFISSLSEQELNSLRTEFMVLNENQICCSLDRFGFLQFCHNPGRQNPNIKIDKVNAFSMALETLFKNHKFTSVQDTLDFKNSTINIEDISISQDQSHWKLEISPQYYQGLEVLFTGIYVFLYSDGVYSMHSSWYKDIYIPSHDVIDYENARKSLIGEKIIWYTFIGDPVPFIVGWENIGSNIEKVILPVETEDLIKFHIAWEIPILMGKDIGWYAYLDTITGEILLYLQQFST
jgi:hypothetical protein